MGKARRIYTDDRTGTYSSTTLRTWLLFFLFFIYASAVAVMSILALAGFIISTDKDLKQSLELIWILGVIALGGGGLYLGKRINERFAVPASDAADTAENVQDRGAEAPDPMKNTMLREPPRGGTGVTAKRRSGRA
ncbi:MAG TPA: hypothetical protein PKY31_00855 [Spirochaetota bacterium]|nr:hypothetical protein [Spirochaetota bacterium]